MFEQPSRVLVGLERMILEIVGFDFRTRHPQKYLAKLVRSLLGPAGHPFYEIAYDISLDAYKTFAPIKQTCLTVALACVRLTSLLTSTHEDVVLSVDPARYGVTRAALAETVLDLLDLYTHFHKSTRLGTRFDLDRFVEVKIGVNDEVEATPGLSRHEFSCAPCADRDVEKSSAVSTSTAPDPVTSLSTTSAFNPVKPGARSSDTTLRFVFSRGEAAEEAAAVGAYFNEEYEEYEVEVEEVIPEPERFGEREPRGPGAGPGPGPGPGPGRGRGRGGGRGGRPEGWGPYPRNPRGHGHHERRGGGGGRRYH